MGLMQRMVQAVRNPQTLAAERMGAYEKRHTENLRIDLDWRIRELLESHDVEYHPELASEASLWWHEKIIPHLSESQLTMCRIMIGADILTNEPDTMVTSIAQQNLIRFYRETALIGERQGANRVEKVRSSNKRALRQGIFTVPKTGSQLEILLVPRSQRGLEFAFLNYVDEKAAKAWLYATSVIPVASVYGAKKEPVNGEMSARSKLHAVNGDLEHSENETDTPLVRVISRYVGKSLREVRNEAIESNEEHALEPLFHDIETQIEEIIAQTMAQGISHGHMHDSNFCIEFIDKNYLGEFARHVPEARSLLDARVVNALPYDERNFTFSLADYLKNPKRWQPVVRLIDFDKANLLSKVHPAVIASHDDGLLRGGMSGLVISKEKVQRAMRKARALRSKIEGVTPEEAFAGTSESLKALYERALPIYAQRSQRVVREAVA